MRALPLVFAALSVLLIMAGCAERPLPAWEPPLSRTSYQHVRTTAYWDGEADHRPYTNHNALGTTLRTGCLNSAAADWSRWPAGTTFRILQTGQTYIVDDYGWDLAGRNTIDLYMPTRGQMDCWGARHVDIQILQWGDPRESYQTLLSRSHYRHVQRMLKELRPQLSEPPPEVAQQPQMTAPIQVAMPVTQPYSTRQTSTVALQPFTN